MQTIYETDVDDKAVAENIARIGNQIFKLLPMREEDIEWKKPLETLIVELTGMSSLFGDQKDMLALVCKLEGLRVGDPDFLTYRRTIFECCGLAGRIKEDVFKNA